MSVSSLFTGELFSLVTLPVLIFLARICDVTIGTMRIIFVNRGLKYLAPVAGFFEVLIWLVAIGQVMAHMTSIQNYIGYALGFATGNFVGIQLENRIAIGSLSLRVTTHRNATALLEQLRAAGHRVAAVEAFAESGPVQLLFMVISRRDLASVCEKITAHDPTAHYIVEDVRLANRGLAAAPRTLFPPVMRPQPLSPASPAANDETRKAS